MSQVNLILNNILDSFEDPTISNNVTKAENYQKLLKLIKDNELSTDIMRRILTICDHDIQVDVKYSVNAINVITVILSKIKVGESTEIDLTKSAVGILELLSKSLIRNLQTIVKMAIKVLLQFPNETLTAVALSNTRELTKITNLYVTANEHKIEQAFIILNTLFNAMPSDEKMVFVTNSLNNWFSNIIPNLIQMKSDNTKELDLLELLTDELKHIDYSENIHWQNTLIPLIIKPDKYPLLMKTLLEKGNENWQRIWIVLVHLLKNQITTNIMKLGSPINSLLPVVELAFKMDVQNRCKAFECWNVLIDNFSSESNESFMKKRLKLLMIPLNANNAKVAEVIAAKFNTWWHLIRRFYANMDNFVNVVLMPFLRFCFGCKNNNAQKSNLRFCMMSSYLQKHSIEAFIEIIGHAICDHCKTLPRLEGKLISTKLLVDYWDDWIYSLKTVLSLCNEINQLQCLKCIWKSFILTIAELPENNIRKDLFDETLIMFTDYIKENINEHSINIAIVKTLSSLLEEKDIWPLLKTFNEEDGPMYKIILIFLSTQMQHSYTSSQDSVKILKPLTNLIFDGTVCSVEHILKWLINQMPVNDGSLVLWMALAESTLECKQKISSPSVTTFILWPLKNMHQLSSVNMCAAIWYNIYTTLPTNTCDDLDKQIIQILNDHQECDCRSQSLMLQALIGIIRKELIDREGCAVQQELELLLKALSNIGDFSQLKVAIPQFIDVHILLFCKIPEYRLNINVARSALSSASAILKLLNVTKEYQLEEANITLIQNLLNEIFIMLNVKRYSELKDKFLEHLEECPDIIERFQENTNLNLISIIKRSKTKKSQKNENSSLNSSKEYFNKPNRNSVTKRETNSNAKIVNTMTEDGEEYVVVEPNWKFNPKKLTDNQKEKFKRKREDIPALYQDLSQSQDEFKNALWNTDSQDTSSTSSRSGTSTLVGLESSVIKEIPRSDVVPKIVQNMLTEKIVEVDSSQNTTNDNIIKEKQLTSNTIKQSPNNTKRKEFRISFQDRIFKNRQALIEKDHDKNTSCTKLDTINMSVSSGCQSESGGNLTSTPKSNTNVYIKNQNLVHSAPSALPADRPSRAKRKPRKYEDSTIFGLKKKRLSLTSQQGSQRDAEDNNAVANQYSHGDVSDVKNDVNIKGRQIVTKAVVHINAECKVIDGKEDVNSCHLEIETQKNIVETPNIELESDIREKANVDRHVVNEQTSTQQNVVASNQITNNISKLTCADITNDTEVIGSSNSISEPSIREIFKNPNEKNNKSTDVEDTTHIETETRSVSNHIINFENKDNITPDIVSDIQPIDVIKTCEPISKNQLNIEIDGENTTKTSNKNQDVDLHTPKSRYSMNSEKRDQQTAVSEKTKKSRIQRELEIDMIDPFLKTPSKEKTLRKLSSLEFDAPTSTKRKIITRNSVIETNKSETKNKRKEKKKPQEYKENKAQNISKQTSNIEQREDNVDSKKHCENLSKSLSDGHDSEDIIESSQESTTAVTPIMCNKKIPVVKLINITKSEDNNITTHHESKSSSSTVYNNVKSDVNNMENSQSLFSKDFAVAIPVPDTSHNQTGFENKKNENQIIESVNPKLLDFSVSEISQNKSAIEDENNEYNQIENMESETLDVDQNYSSSKHESVVNDNNIPLIDIASEDTTYFESDTIDAANADTEPIDIQNTADAYTDPMVVVEPDKSNIEVSLKVDSTSSYKSEPVKKSSLCDLTEKCIIEIQSSDDEEIVRKEKLSKSVHENQIRKKESITVEDSQNSETSTVSNIITHIITEDTDTILSQNEVQRKKDFFNSTLEISPIKNLSPVDDDESKSSEISNDYVVIKLSSPVQSNGEPFEDKNESHEIFTNENVSPDKRESTPPREDPILKHSSPSSALSLKKNKPQVRPSGRAAQMLGLCVPESLQTISNCEKSSEVEDTKRTSVLTPARRNLRILYNSVSENENTTESQENDNFLKFKRLLPPFDSSPSVPILKRKLTEISDECTVSPANKRKRVSFHDPPVSNTMSVQKYIEPYGIRSPQSSLKKQDRQLRQTTMKSPKRLDNVFKLESVLSNAVESFTDIGSTVDTEELNSLDQTPTVDIVKGESSERVENVSKFERVLIEGVNSFIDIGSTEDTDEMSSMDTTPAIEIVKASDLNDTDSICPALINCTEPIDLIASELSSSAMSNLLIQELKGKVDTIGDLAKMTELEVNRLCIKTPKVTVAKKALSDYLSRIEEKEAKGEDMECDSEMVHPVELKDVSREVQTDYIDSTDMGMQTESNIIAATTQTDVVSVAHSETQTNHESGFKSLSQLIISSMNEENREDCFRKLAETELQKLSLDLTTKAVPDDVCDKILDVMLEEGKNLTYMTKYLRTRLSSNELLTLCSQFLSTVVNEVTSKNEPC